MLPEAFKLLNILQSFYNDMENFYKPKEQSSTKSLYMTKICDWAYQNKEYIDRVSKERIKNGFLKEDAKWKTDLIDY